MNDVTISDEVVAAINALHLKGLKDRTTKGVKNSASLSARAAASSKAADQIGPIEFADRASRIDLFGMCGGEESWKLRTTPIMTDGISEKPGGSTSGEILTAGLRPGGVSYGANLVNDSADNERFWIHNWRCLIALPPAPSRSKLQYRFGVNGIANVLSADVALGGLSTFVTVGTTSDINAPITNWTTVGWPAQVVLPASDPLYFAADVPVSGQFEVGQGRTAAVGLIVGVVVSVKGGTVAFRWGDFNIHRPGAADGLTFEDTGRIGYRFCPVLVIDPG